MSSHLVISYNSQNISTLLSPHTETRCVRLPFLDPLLVVNTNFQENDTFLSTQTFSSQLRATRSNVKVCSSCTCYKLEYCTVDTQKCMKAVHDGTLHTDVSPEYTATTDDHNCACLGGSGPPQRFSRPAVEDRLEQADVQRPDLHVQSICLRSTVHRCKSSNVHHKCSRIARCNGIFGRLAAILVNLKGTNVIWLQPISNSTRRRQL